MKFINKLVLLLSLFLLVIPFALSDNTATIKYTLDHQGTGVTTIVKGVPFTVDVTMDLAVGSGTPSITYFEIYTKSADLTDATFAKGGSYQWLRTGPSGASTNCDTPSLIVDGMVGSVWEYAISSGCSKSQSGTSMLLEKLKVTTSSNVDGKITLYTTDTDTQSNNVGNNDFDYIVQNPTEATELPVSPQDSACGDGVVDKTISGEQCDDGNTNNDDGCSSTCKIEKVKGWDCTVHVGNGDRKSGCSRLSNLDLFKNKMDKLLKGECFPNNPSTTEVGGQEGDFAPYADQYLYCNSSGAPELPIVKVGNDYKIDPSLSSIKKGSKISRLITLIFQEVLTLRESYK